MAIARRSPIAVSSISRPWLLVAGDEKGLGEPSLALTIPTQPSDLDDGVLTASEVALLKLNPEWVVLSACKTIAGDTPGAALSGRTRARSSMSVCARS